MPKPRPRGGESKGRTSRYWWAVGLSALLVVGVALAWLTLAPREVATIDPGISSATVVPSSQLRETRPTLDPALFVGKAALAHQVARRIPEVLDQLYCYCECDKHMGHKSLLSCYTDGHAAT